MRRAAMMFVAVAALGVSGCGDSSIEVRKAVDVNAEPEAVWAAIGGWCAINDWHPAIEQCEATEEDGETRRVLTTGDGGKINERQTDKDDMSYTYKIIDSPLPVENYKAKFAVEKGSDGGSKVSWEASFDPKGDAKKAEETIAGIFDAGMTGIKKMVDK